MVSGDRKFNLGVSRPAGSEGSGGQVSQPSDALSLPFAARARPLASAEAFARLYDRTHLIVFRYIYGNHGGPQEDVEDLTADTYIRAWRARRRFEGDESDALSWLLQIARRLVIDAHRRRGRRGIPDDIDDLDLTDGTVSPEHRVLMNEQHRVLLLTLNTLNDRQREIVVLRYMLGWKVKNIARHLDMEPNTVSVNIRRALKRLRRRWPEKHLPYPVEGEEN